MRFLDINKILQIDLQFFIQLRDCFYGGYSLPQYCIDNKIFNPLIVAINPEFLWETYVQFRYDKRINADFCLIHDRNAKIVLSPACVLENVPLKNFDYNEFNSHEKIIMLTVLRINNSINEKVIYLDSLFELFKNHVYAEIPIYNYINSHKNVKIVLTTHPYLKCNQLTTDYEKFVLNNDIHSLRNKLKSDKKISTRYDRFGYTHQEIYDLLEMTGAKNNSDGSTSLLDSDNFLVGVKNGKRITAYQPNKYENTIYFMGTCTFFGIGAAFDRTIESYLQKKLNENGYNYRVENESQFFAGRYQDIFYNLNALPVKDGDIIFMFIQDLQVRNVPFLDLRNIFDRPHNLGEIFVDAAHLNEIGYKLMAEVFYQVLVKYSFFKNYNFDIPKIEILSHSYGIPTPLSISESHIEKFKFDAKLTQNLKDYKKMLQKNRVNIGCIVMNCNPFTLGHRYLIEYAVSKVAFLYIFVVEEDKSEFSFADRFELVKQGVQDISRVKVLPSGKFIISQLTFSGYFNKANLQNTNVDSKSDIEIFATEIAPELGINVRFAGEEPNDTVTKQYNENMKKILPNYGIDFVEIPRKTINNEVISAKRVRILLKQKNFAEISKLVPTTTLKYLEEITPPPPPPPHF